MACARGILPVAVWVLQPSWLSPPYTAFQYYPIWICTLKRILTCKQFLAKSSCLENTTVMGSKTALTSFQKYVTTEACTKDDHYVFRQHSTVQRKPRAQCWAMWIWPGHVIWPQPVLFSMSYNNSLAVQIQLKTTFMNLAFHRSARRRNGLWGAPSECLLLLSPRWRKPAENSSTNAQISELTSKWKTTVLQKGCPPARSADGHRKKLEQDLDQSECLRKWLRMQKWLRQSKGSCGFLKNWVLHIFFFFELKLSLIMFSALLFMPLCGLYTFI